MIIPRLSTHLLLQPCDVPASRDDFEVVGVFNPGSVRMKDEIVLLVRVAERPRERRLGFTGLPRWDPSGELVVDWAPDQEWEPIDPRVVRRKTDGLIRLNFTSHLRVVRCSDDGKVVREMTDVTFDPQGEMEEFGVEDPRITAIDGRFYFTYVAVSRHGPATALASTSDFLTFDRHGIIFCSENKDVVLFPKKIRDGKYLAIHRPVCGTPFTKPEMWFAQSSHLTHWGDHAPLSLTGGDWQSGRVGAGPPPILIPQGWLLIYHGNQLAPAGHVGAYYGGALLLDKDNPAKILAKTTNPFFRPETNFETLGFVPNVVFPTGLVLNQDSLLIHYGAADTNTAIVEFSLKELLKTMTD